jgi:hypothetical protein
MSGLVDVGFVHVVVQFLAVAPRGLVVAFALDIRFIGVTHTQLSTLTTSLSPPQERDEGKNQEYEEQDLRDPRGTRGNTTEAQNGRDDGDDEENHCVVKHLRYLPMTS